MIPNFSQPAQSILPRLSTLVILVLLGLLGLPEPSDAAMPIILRLHMVRHGETEANKANYVLGQRESPLTVKGISQAVALGEFQRHRRQAFWRAYASDYDRTLKTARLILGSADEGGEGEPSCSSDVGDEKLQVQIDGDSDSGAQTSGVATIAAKSASSSAISEPRPVIQDKRLRERAKGVREGRPKTVTYDEAVKLHKLENGEDTPLPLLESDEDVWVRVKDWIDEVATEACRDIGPDEDSLSYKELLDSKQIPPATITDSNEIEYERSANVMGREKMDSEVDPRNQIRRRDVLVVSHSATIRTAVNRLVGDQLPPNIVRGAGGDDGAAKGMLVVPNTSQTIVDIAVMTQGADASSPPKWRAELVELTNTDHLT